MDNSGTTLQNLKEKTFVYAKKAFAVAVDEKIPKTQNTLLDESMMIKLGIKPTKIMTQRFAYAGNLTRIVAEARFTAQTVLNGLPAGNTFLKVFVVRDLSLFYGVDAIAGGKLFTKLSTTQNDDSFTDSDAKPKKESSKAKSASPVKTKPTKKQATPKNESKTKPEVPQIFFRNLYPEMYSPGSPRPLWERSPRYSSPSSSCSSPQWAIGAVTPLCSPTCHTASRRARTLSENHDELCDYSDEDDVTYDNIYRIVENEFYSENHDELRDYSDYSDEDADTYDNISRIVENEFGYEGPEGTVVHRVLPYPRPGILPPDFLPCGQNCAHTSCGCLRRYSGWDFMS